MLICSAKEVRANTEERGEKERREFMDEKSVADY